MEVKKTNCPTCGAATHSNKSNLWILDGFNYIFFECPKCGCRYWIEESEFDKLEWIKI